MSPLHVTALALLVLLGAALGAGCCLAGSSDESDGSGLVPGLGGGGDDDDSGGDGVEGGAAGGDDEADD